MSPQLVSLLSACLVLRYHWTRSDLRRTRWAILDSDDGSIFEARTEGRDPVRFRVGQARRRVAA